MTVEHAGPCEAAAFYAVREAERLGRLIPNHLAEGYTVVVVDAATGERTCWVGHVASRCEAHLRTAGTVPPLQPAAPVGWAHLQQDRYPAPSTALAEEDRQALVAYRAEPVVRFQVNGGTFEVRGSDAAVRAFAAVAEYGSFISGRMTRLSWALDAAVQILRAEIPLAPTDPRRETLATALRSVGIEL